MHPQPTSVSAALLVDSTTPAAKTSQEDKENGVLMTSSSSSSPVSAASTPAVGSTEACADSGIECVSGEGESPALNGGCSLRLPGEDDEPEQKQNTTATTTVDQLVLVHDAGFGVKIAPPGGETFELQVSSMEMVQEIHQVLMDREETCHRTCFSLRLDNQPLDNFTELKNIDGLREGCTLKIVQEPYTIREARIHLRHVRDLVKNFESADLYNGVDCCSVSFLNSVTNGSAAERKRLKLDSSNAECLPPEYATPGFKELSLLPLLPPKETCSAPTPCLKVLSPSGWNPPPGNRKLHGDLMYIYVLTVEDKRYHITCCTKGFYVNESTEEEFNPKAASPKYVHHSLVDLLSQLSPAFRKNFVTLQKKRCQRHPFERVATPYALYNWTAPAFEHAVDFIRAEDAFSFKLGYEEHIPGQTREWNEELQTTRELPRSSLPERLLRERAIFKVHSDFVAAATRGATAVVDGNVMAINPGDESKMQMFIWNNIFFSLGYDVKDHYKDFGGDAAAFVAPNNDLQGVRSYFNLDTEGLYTLGTVVVDYRGYRVTAQSIIPGILERDQEQSVVYGSIDFGKTVVAAEKYQELLKKPAQQLKLLPHRVHSANGQAVTLYSSVESKGIVGNDGRHYILDLLRTFPPDVHYLADDGEVNEGSKAHGFPRQHPHKFSCLRRELIDAFVESRYVAFIKAAAADLQNGRLQSQNKDVQPDQQNDTSNVNGTVTGSESLLEKASENEAKQLVEKFKSSSLVCADNGEKDDAQPDRSTIEIVRRAAAAVGSLSEDEFDLRFNPDCYSPTVSLAEENDAVQKQKRLIRDAAEFLLTTQIPNFIQDCYDHTFLPMDGATLSEALHNRGINIRYLGKVLQSTDDSPALQHLKMLCKTELLCRSAKRTFRTYLVGLDRHCVGSAAVAHFLNCLLCSTVAGCQQRPSQLADELVTKAAASSLVKASSAGAKGKKKKAAVAALVENADNFDWALTTSKSLWASLTHEMDVYFGYRTDCESVDSFVEEAGIQKISLLRRFCAIAGVQVLCRDYDFDCKQRSVLLFGEEDVLNLFPVVKHVSPKASDAYALYASGQAKIQQGRLRAGYELVSEALNSLNNVYGAVHPELAQCLRLSARLAYILGDHQEALSQQHKAALMSERCNGLDHAQTILEYTHLALYCFANLQVGTALQLLYRARYLLSLANGDGHPHMALLDSNVGLILHAVGEYDASLRFLDNALHLTRRFFGARSLKTASAFHLLARTQSCRGDFRSALQHEKDAFAVYKALLGDEHEKTRESGECLKHLTQQAVTFQKRMNEITRTAGSVSQLLPLQVQQPSFGSVLEMLNVINGIVFIQISPQEVEALRAELEKTSRENGAYDDDGRGDSLALD